MKYLIGFFLILLFVMCKSKTENDTTIEIDAELEELVAVMAGSFSSSRQAKSDTLYNDYTLRLVPIWGEREGYWLYSEQSLSDSLEIPSKQYIYRLSRENDSLIRSDIYTFPNSDLWIGKWETPEFFDRLLLETIALRKGCEVLIQKIDDKFIGKTNGKNCPDTLHGAVYATSELEISKNRMVSWERGFNENDSLMWGSQKGGYVFDKLKE